MYATRFIIEAMLDGASLEQAVELAQRFIQRANGGPPVILANLKNGKWVSSPFDWIPTMRTVRASTVLTASVHAIKVSK